MSVLQSQPTYRHFPSDTCRCCSAPILTAKNIRSNPRWLFHSVSRTRHGVDVISLVQGCDACSDMDVELEDARLNNRRFTEIQAFNHECDHGMRCSCGSVALARYGKCVICSRAYRMLDKITAQSRIVANLLNDLRRQSKSLLKEEKHGR